MTQPSKTPIRRSALWMVFQPGWTSWTQQARRSLVPCGSSTCAPDTASCWCLPLMTGRVSTRWASFSHRSSESRTETISPSCWLETRQIWRHSARSPDLKPLPLVPPTMWPTSRPRPSCASMWTKPSSSWCGLSGSTRNKSSHPAHPPPPGRKMEAVPVSFCSPKAVRGATSTRDQLPSPSLFPHLGFPGYTTPSPGIPGLLQDIATLCLLPVPPFPTPKPLVGVRGSRASGSLLYITPLSTPREINFTANVRKCFLGSEDQWWVNSWRTKAKVSLHLPPSDLEPFAWLRAWGAENEPRQARWLDLCIAFSEGHSALSCLGGHFAGMGINISKKIFFSFLKSSRTALFSKLARNYMWLYKFTG